MGRYETFVLIRRVLLMALLAAFLLWVWPTPWRYTSVTRWMRTGNVPSSSVTVA